MDSNRSASCKQPMDSFFRSTVYSCLTSKGILGCTQAAAALTVSKHTLHACHTLGCVNSQVLQKALDWLAEQPEDASELAALLSEAVPKLGFHTQKSRLPGISRAATSKQSLELLHADMSLLQRLKAARPMPVGKLPTSTSLLKFLSDNHSSKGGIFWLSMRCCAVGCSGMFIPLAPSQHVIKPVASVSAQDTLLYHHCEFVSMLLSLY